jgi:hypothetical protein
MDEVRSELIGRAQLESPVSTRIVGGQLYNGSPDNCGEGSQVVSVSCGGLPCVMESRSELGPVSICQGNQPQICPVGTAGPCQSNQTPVFQTQDLQNQDCDDDNACGSNVLREAQERAGDVAIIYRAVQDQNEVEQSVVNLGSAELRKLSTMISLMRIRDDGVLVVRVLIGQRSREAIVCPQDMRKREVWASHTLSHAGIMRTLRRLRLTWYWPGMTSDVRRLVRSCEICQRAKSGGLRPSSRQGPLWVGRPWQKVAIDLVGPMPVTARGNRWILVLSDHFTRWQDALALPDATAPIVAEALDSRVFVILDSRKSFTLTVDPSLRVN